VGIVVYFSSVRLAAHSSDSLVLPHLGVNIAMPASEVAFGDDLKKEIGGIL